MQMALARAKSVAVENPIGIMSSCYRKSDQIIHPWQYALTSEENTAKSTCLWLYNLPKLKPIHQDRPEIKYFEWYDQKAGRIKRQTEWYYMTRRQGPKERGKLASKTFPGIARAMAEQWSEYLEKENNQ